MYKRQDEAFQKFEDQVDQQFQKTSNAIKDFVKENENLNFQLPEHLGDSVSSKAQEMLGKLDSNLQNVEELTQGYWKTVSKGSFWSSIADSISNQFSEALNLDKAGELSDAKTAASGDDSITDIKLKQLSLDSSQYLKFDKKKLSKDFVIGSRSNEIEGMLTADPDLKKLLNSLVPSELPEEEFWNIHFTLRQMILDMASKKRNLEEIKKEHEKEAQLGWDDEDEDEVDGGVHDGNVSSHKEMKKVENSSEAEEDTASISSSRKTTENEDDDDWE